jgi:hypothetical protein
MRHLASAALALPLLSASLACSDGTSSSAGAPAASSTASAPPPSGSDPHAGHDAHGGHGGAAAGTPAPTSARSVAFVWPQAGSTVFSEFDLAFGLQGMGVRKAGEDIADKTTGHHHLIIDGAAIPAGQPVPKDDKHIHYGDGASTVRVTLAPGEHSLTAQLADGAHLSYGPELSATMKVTVVPKPPKVGIAFANVKDGDVVKSPLELKFAVEGFTVKPAGEAVLDKTSGHHHVIIDSAPVPLGVVVPKDDKHIHFGKGETSTSLTLTPGEHTLTLQFADGAHLSFGPAMATTIKVKVQ